MRGTHLMVVDPGGWRPTSARLAPREVGDSVGGSRRIYQEGPNSQGFPAESALPSSERGLATDKRHDRDGPASRRMFGDEESPARGSRSSRTPGNLCVQAAGARSIRRRFVSYVVVSCVSTCQRMTSITADGTVMRWRNLVFVVFMNCASCPHRPSKSLEGAIRRGSGVGRRPAVPGLSIVAYAHGRAACGKAAHKDHVPAKHVVLLQERAPCSRDRLARAAERRAPGGAAVVAATLVTGVDGGGRRRMAAACDEGEEHEGGEREAHLQSVLHRLGSRSSRAPVVARNVSSRLASVTPPSGDTDGAGR
jgi:hypothetical protein